MIKKTNKKLKNSEDPAIIYLINQTYNSNPYKNKSLIINN